MAEHYIPSNPFYSATVLHSAMEQYRPGSRNADEAGGIGDEIGDEGGKIGRVSSSSASSSAPPPA